MIRKLESKDIANVVAIHMASFPGFFLSFLGPKFLTLFYSGVCIAPESIAFVYLNVKGVPIGFVAGALNPGGFYSRLMMRDFLRFGWASLSPMIKNPKIIWRLARAISHPSSNNFGNNVAGLFSIGVHPDSQGNGAGNLLVNAFLNEAKLKNCTKVYLTTDRDNNEAGNKFYTNLGFNINRQYATPEGRRMNQYCIDLK
jgi:ribosomal protein S18 acetylase RimI-like enzyme